MKKLVAMVLVLSMMFTMGVNAFAQQPKQTADELFLEPETIQIVGENGQVYNMTIQDVTSAGAGARDSSTGDNDGGVLPGTIRAYRVTLSNEELDFGFKVGTLLSESAQLTLAEGVTAKLAQNLLLEMGFAWTLLEVFQAYNIMMGINGYEAVIEVEWKYFDSNIAGEEGYAWSFNRLISIGTY